MFSHSKKYRMHSTPEEIGEDLNETTANFLGWGSKGLQELYPLVKFSSVKDVLEKTQFDWHDDVKHLIKDTKIELLDKNTFKITAVYEQQADWTNLIKFVGLIQLKVMVGQHLKQESII